MTTTTSPSLYHKKSSEQEDHLLIARLSYLSVFVSTTSIELSSKVKQSYSVSKKFLSTAGVHSMSLANCIDAAQERSSLLTLDRLTAVRRCGRMLESDMRSEIERLWREAHTTEFFNSTDMRLVERAEGIIHGLRDAASKAAGSC